MLGNGLTHMEQQKTETLQDIAELTEQITDTLITGGDAAGLLATRQAKLALAEALDVAMVKAQRIWDNAQHNICLEQTAQLIQRIQAR